MKIDELRNMTLGEVLDNYCAVMSPECCYYYGIFKDVDIEKVYEEYNIEKDYPEAFAPEPLIHDDLIYDGSDEVGDYEKLERIMYNLGISRKGESDGEID